MASLTYHLRQPESHGRLSFHSGCPICRAERLSGRLGGDALLGQRGQASVLATTLAVSSLALPSTAFAQMDDERAPVAQTPDSELDRIDADDGTQPDAPAAEDDGGFGGENLIAPEPDDGVEAPEPTPLSELAPEQAGEEIEPIVESAPQAQASPAPPAASAPELAPTPTAPAPVAPSPAAPSPGALEDRAVGEPAHPKVRHLRLRLDPVRAAVSTERPTTKPVAPPSAPAPEVAAAAPEAPTSRTSLPARSRGTRDAYTVRPGDSLWSIAGRILGPEASIGRIAREVNRLWELNRDRIATGNPSLLPVGTELEL